MAQRSFDEGKVPFHFFDATSDFEHDVVANGDRVSVSHGKVGGLTGSLQLTIYYPTTNFVHQGRLDTSVEGIQPTLEIGMWMP
jgi:hypothetical protein